jgi:methylated-DNA-[protein]-cysteine S-methyltransferase
MKPDNSRPDPNVVWRGSRFGAVAVVWSYHGDEPKICRIVIPKPRLPAMEAVSSSLPGSVETSCAIIDRVADEIVAVLSGEDLRFSLDSVRLDLCSEFQEKVLRAEHAIPRGSVSTYERIARHIGKPTAARAVGSALARNPFPLIIPCHRVIRSDGTLGGYQGGTKMKRALLGMEGIDFDDSDRVLAPYLFY